MVKPSSWAFSAVGANLSAAAETNAYSQEQRCYKDKDHQLTPEATARWLSISKPVTEVILSPVALTLLLSQYEKVIMHKNLSHW